MPEKGTGPAGSPVEDWLQRAWKHEPHVDKLVVDKTDIAIRDFGGRGPPLIFVHGYCAHSRWWDHIAPHFTQTHRTVACDLSGMGDSGWRDHYSLEQHGREVLAICRSYGFNRPIIAGHSYGGRVALAACRLDPDYVARAILVDTVLPAAKRLIPAKAEREQPYYPDREALLARFRLSPPGRWPEPSVLQYIAGHSLARHQEGWSWKFDCRMAASLNHDATAARLSSQVPMDFIYAELSERVLPEHASQLRSLLPTCGKPIQIPLSHHHVMVEQPIALVAALRGLLAGRLDRGDEAFAEPI